MAPPLLSVANVSGKRLLFSISIVRTFLLFVGGSYPLGNTNFFSSIMYEAGVDFDAYLVEVRILCSRCPDLRLEVRRLLILEVAGESL